MQVLLDGKKASEHYLNKIEVVCKSIIEHRNHVPHLAVIMLGDDSRSTAYVNAKIKMCDRLGFKHTLVHFKKSISETTLLQQVERLNNNSDISGIIVQLPLPRHISSQKVITTIRPQKDVDGFTTESLGKLVINESTFVSATPLGILMMIDYYHIPIKDKHIVVLGRSNIVGRPISILLSSNHRLGNGTVTLCHSKTTHFEHYTKQADIIIIAIGKAKFLKKSMIKEGATIIDIGINTVYSEEKSKHILVGDADFNHLKDKAYAITPVPGGVGRMTIVALMLNTLEAYLLQNDSTIDNSIFSFQ